MPAQHTLQLTGLDMQGTAKVVLSWYHKGIHYEWVHVGRAQGSTFQTRGPCKPQKPMPTSPLHGLLLSTRVIEQPLQAPEIPSVNHLFLFGC